MATVLRVKRRNNDQPQDALILCKYPRLAEDSDDDVACSGVIPTVAKFAGTLNDPKENVLKHLAKTLNMKELETSFKKSPCVNLLAQRRKQTKENSAANRYKVVNCHRSLDTSSMEEFEDKVMTFVDIEDSISLAVNQSTAAAEKKEKNSDYAYDLYYVENCDSIDDCVLIHPYNEQELVYEMPTEDLQSEHDSEDSNAESYYQNSYPDTDNSDNDSIDEDDMRTAIRNLEDCHLSSEDDDYKDYGDEPYPLDMKDVELHGYKYARYKQRMKPLLYGDIAADDQNTDSSDTDSSDTDSSDTDSSDSENER
ncbi:probable RNA polymerase II nuclear localization protein SLC7A6OS [Odontomachus brunneus]|uniref:probable RNA polymerase II nuclear localization protein SLC7A6OS n=1 Tax=Odontomachus brunneus TaxID=486640 RepID=UPI0013F1B7DA|nr:probable RNA polymerase II nuclear localization protein SLC7A6OS [Odontomachus brunneus]